MTIPPRQLMQRIADSDTLDAAYLHVCDRRKVAGPHADIWTLRRNWSDARDRLRAELAEGTYHPDPVRCCSTNDGDVWLWSARDAVVLRSGTSLPRDLP